MRHSKGYYNVLLRNLATIPSRFARKMPIAIPIENTRTMVSLSIPPLNLALATKEETLIFAHLTATAAFELFQWPKGTHNWIGCLTSIGVFFSGLFFGILVYEPSATAGVAETPIFHQRRNPNYAVKQQASRAVFPLLGSSSNIPVVNSNAYIHHTLVIQATV